MSLRCAPRRLCLLLCLALLGAASLACGDVLGAKATATPEFTSTPLPPTPTPTPRPSPTPTPQPTPLPDLSPGDAIVVGGVLRTRQDPSTASQNVGSLRDLQQVHIARSVQGENWLVGTQTWVGISVGWASQWFQLDDGSYVYGPFIFILADGETSPLAPAPNGEEKWIDVNLSQQTARAMVGDKAVFEAPISSGAKPFETPQGSFEVQPDGRIAVEKMTASQAGYDPSQAQYDVERVLFTQYFDQKGDALHLNYWRPHSVFGHQATSHGCVGMELHEAQYFWLFAQAGTRVEIHT
jgi:lipoprotein-anchoring transpeptidase ErfK/SrfK